MGWLAVLMLEEVLQMGMGGQSVDRASGRADA